MNGLKFLANMLQDMKQDKVSNYVIAGLDSYLVSNGNVRMFENSRNHQDQITPHSHRFNFACLVLEGSVINREWFETSEEEGDFFESTILHYNGKIGSHTKSKEGRSFYAYLDTKHKEGDCYAMSAQQIHSIQFSKGAKVLFLEGPQITDTSIIIEPVIDGVVIPTYENKPYMFNQGDSK
tara:strand:+ start:64 stop:603 length:540 start_codon:yes stop_codon:yes gene_type:complete